MLELLKLKTYVYIDGSNIRNALRKAHFDVDFIKLYEYIKQKYNYLEAVKYFEGVDIEDKEKKALFDEYTKAGMIIRSLERKSYTSKEKYTYIACEHCQKKNKVVLREEKTTLKSNIDVFLSTEIFADLIINREPLHVVIVSCDGDFAEVIKKVLELYPKTFVTVVATPFRKYGNYLSTRLHELKDKERYSLMNILTAKDKIGTKHVQPKPVTSTV